MDNQIRTKPKILKKWIGMGKKKCDYNCHTNFTSLRLAKSDAPNGGRLKGDIPFDQLANGNEAATCQSVAKPSEANNKINFAKENEPIKEKSGRLPGKAAGKDTTSLFNIIFKSLTSSSSNSNPSDNMSQQNSASNERLNALAANNQTAGKEPSERNPPKSNNKSFDLNDEMKLNLSLNSLQASPQRLAISIQNLPEN